MVVLVHPLMSGASGNTRLASAEIFFLGGGCSLGCTSYMLIICILMSRYADNMHTDEQVNSLFWVFSERPNLEAA